MKTFYQIATSGRQSDIYIFGDIVTPDEKSWAEFWGDESPTSGLSIVKDISELNADIINVHINSYGGVVSEGMAIYNALKHHPAKIITYNDGFCASAAVMPWLAGDERIASSCSAFLFHQVMTSVSGNADDMRAAAEELDALTELTMGPYMVNATIPEEEMKAVFQKGGWLKPQQVKDIGLATAIEDYVPEDRPSASVKGAFFMQFFNQEREATTQAVEVSFADMFDVKQLAHQIKALMDAEESKEPHTEENKTIKFLNALMMGRKD